MHKLACMSTICINKRVKKLHYSLTIVKPQYVPSVKETKLLMSVSNKINNIYKPAAKSETRKTIHPKYGIKWFIEICEINEMIK